MSYKGKIPHQYDKGGKNWKAGAFRNQIGKRATEANRDFLARRLTSYHRFTEREGFRNVE
jgi:hypothetical protein